MLKKIELKIKTVINKIITVDRKTYPLSQVKNAFYFEKNPKILLLRHDRIGDLLTSTSFVRILKQNNPTAKIDILLSKKNISAKNCIQKYVNKIWILENNFIKYLLLLWKLNRKKYDLIIDLFDSHSTTSSIIIKFSNPVFALGIEKSNSKIYDYTVPMLDRFNSNIVERVCNLLIAFGIEPQKQDLSLEYPVNNDNNFSCHCGLDPQSPCKYSKDAINGVSTKRDCGSKPAMTGTPVNNTKFRIGINLAGANEARFWGKENNEKLLKHLFERYKNFEIRLFYTSQYSEIAKDFSQMFNENSYPNLITGICNSFDEFANEVSKCNFIISPDTSIVHLASAFKIPSLFLYLFNPNSTHSPWFPYNSQYKAITTNSASLQSISFSEVVRTVDEMLENLISE